MQRRSFKGGKRLMWTGIIRRSVFALIALMLLSTVSWAAPFAYVADYDSSISSDVVQVIDIATDTLVATIPVGAGDYWIAVSRNGSIVASTDGSSNVSLVDASTNTALGTVSGVGSEPEGVAVNSTGTTVYVADEGGEDLYVIDVASLTVTAGPIDLSASGCDEPERIVISPDDAFLYIPCAGPTSAVIRVSTAGFAITTVAAGLASYDPHGIALNCSGTRLYYTDGTDSLEWDTTTQALTGTVFTGCSMYGGAVSPDGSRLYCVEEGSDLEIYATSNGALLGTVALGGWGARDVAVNPDGTSVYVPLSGLDSVVVVDPVAMTVVDSVAVGTIPRGIAIAPPAVCPGTTTAPTAIPTMNEWGMIIFMVLAGLGSVWAMRRAHSAPVK